METLFGPEFIVQHFPDAGKLGVIPGARVVAAGPEMFGVSGGVGAMNENPMVRLALEILAMAFSLPRTMLG